MTTNEAIEAARQILRKPQPKIYAIEYHCHGEQWVEVGRSSKLKLAISRARKFWHEVKHSHGVRVTWEGMEVWSV